MNTVYICHVKSESCRGGALDVIPKQTTPSSLSEGLKKKHLSKNCEFLLNVQKQKLSWRQMTDLEAEIIIFVGLNLNLFVGH